MTDEAWNAPFVRCLGVHLAGDAITEVDERGERFVGDTMLLLLNQSLDAIAFTLPDHAGRSWELVFDTAEPPPEITRYCSCNTYSLRPRSMALLKAIKREPAEPAVAAL